jgi:hypothetical protein
MGKIYLRPRSCARAITTDAKSVLHTWFPGALLPVSPVEGEVDVACTGMVGKASEWELRYFPSWCGLTF